MSEVAVFASGNGSNFEAITRFLLETPHRVCCLICDREGAGSIARAKTLSVPVHLVTGWGVDRTAAEDRALDILANYGPDLVVLAGFMRILTPRFLEMWRNRVINIHPSLLPKYPGTRGIQDSYESKDPVVGITIHLVDEGVDTGTILLQKSIPREKGDLLEDVEERIHALEHHWYPRVIKDLLEGSDRG